MCQLNTRGMKIGVFQEIYRFISKTVRDTTIVTMEDKRDLYAIYRMVPFPVTFNDPNLNFNVTILFNVR